MDNRLTDSSTSSFDFELTSRWLSGIPYEVAFWRSYYRRKRSREVLMGWSMLNKECELDHFDMAAFVDGLGKENPQIVDVGCALTYMLANKIGGKEYKVVYLDPLAPYYNEILNDYSLDYPRITFGMGETLSLIFPTESVSFFHIRNALDHSAVPMMVIWQALMCLHVGGVLYLNHKPNEAEHEAYIGFHQYNVDCQDGRLIIWNKENRVDVGAELAEFADVKTTVTDEGRIVAVITKKKSLPADHRIVKESSEYASAMQMALLTYFHSASNVAKYQLRRFSFTIGHTVMRLLPYGLVKSIKRIISGKK